MSKRSKMAEVGEQMAIGAGATVAGTLAVGAIGSIITCNPAPLMAAFHIAPSAAAHGAAIGAGGSGSGGSGS